MVRTVVVRLRDCRDLRTLDYKWKGSLIQHRLSKMLKWLVANGQTV